MIHDEHGPALLSQDAPDLSRHKGPTETRSGMTLLATLPAGVRIIGMTQFKGELIVATEYGLYVYRDSEFRPIPITLAPNEKATK